MILLLPHFCERRLELLAVRPNDAIVEPADGLALLDALALHERLSRGSGRIVQEPEDAALNGGRNPRGAIGKGLRRAH